MPFAAFSLLPSVAERRALLLFFWLLGALAAPAQAQDSTLTRLLRQHQYALTPAGTQFASAGWDSLQANVRKSQFVLVGEDHGTAQIPAFVAALAQVFQPAVYVAEIDEYQAQDVNRLAAQPGLPVAFQRQHPMALAFYSWAEEFELVRTLRAQHVRLLGLDQVSNFTPGRFYARLAEQTKNNAARAYLRQRAAAYQAHDRAVMGTNPNALTMLHQSAATLDSLLALARAESPAVQRMAQAYVASARIYQSQRHLDRINLLKRNLLRGLPPQPAQPKALFKFGAFHMARGASLFGGVFDIGNLALNLAGLQDKRSLHVLIMGKQGTRAQGFNLEDFSKNVAPYSNAGETFLKPFAALTTGPAWQVFDLRPLRRALRTNQLPVSSQALATTINGYDFVVIIPETTASHNY